MIDLTGNIQLNSFACFCVTKPYPMRTGLLLQYNQDITNMLMTIQNLSKCVIAPILATCALKDVMPEVGGRGGGGLGGVNVCLSGIQT